MSIWSDRHDSTRGYHGSMHRTLLITSKSDCEIPGPPFLGILSPPWVARRWDGSKLEEQSTYGDVNDVDDVIRKLS
jgi:hypothetical protein